MKKLLGKKLNKKGFTLAELLIVVAIIAILVAIALPLFFGALDNARKARDDANKRAAKAAAVNAVLSNPNEYSICQKPNGEPMDDGVPADCWSVTAYISDDGTIEITSILPFKLDAGGGHVEDMTDSFKKYTGTDSKYIGKYEYLFFIYAAELEFTEP